MTLGNMKVTLVGYQAMVQYMHTLLNAQIKLHIPPIITIVTLYESIHIFSPGF